MTEHCDSEMVERGTFLVPTLAALGNILSPHRDKVPDHVLEKALRTTEAHRQSLALFREASGRIAPGNERSSASEAAEYLAC